VSKSKSHRRWNGEFAGFVVGIVAWAVLIVVFVSVWRFHADNIALCDKLGGSYEAFGGSGECIKDQVILFDPRHDYEETTK
jgi:hypothetical protein